MLHPLFSTLVQRPDLVVDHLSAYAALFHDEASSAASALLTRAVAWVLVVLSAVVFLGLAGTALMLGLLQNQFHWGLVAVPGFALGLLLIAFFVAKKPLQSERFTELKAQMDSDKRALRSVA
jgi:hypothetical protein